MNGPFNYREQRMFMQDILRDLERRLEKLEGADRRIELDVALYGRAYLVDGQRVSPDRIVIIAAPTGGHCERAAGCTCGVERRSAEGCGNWVA